MLNAILDLLPPAPLPNGHPELVKLLDVIYKCETPEQLLVAREYLRLWVKRHRDYVIGYAMTTVLRDKTIMFRLRNLEAQVEVKISTP